MAQRIEKLNTNLTHSCKTFGIQLINLNLAVKMGFECKYKELHVMNSYEQSNASPFFLQRKR